MSTDKNLITTDSAPGSVVQTGEKNLFITNSPNGTVNVNNGSTTEYDENGVPLTPISPVRLDSQKHIIYFGNEKINIPAELESPDLLTNDELPYVNALYDVYTEKTGEKITPDNINAISPKLHSHFTRQQRAYYRADYVYHVARETFADGESQFKTLEQDAYDGLEETLFDEDIENGFDRLKAVLEESKSIPLTKSCLTNIIGLIGNIERRGICHVLVNDDFIKSWVNPDE